MTSKMLTEKKIFSTRYDEYKNEKNILKKEIEKIRYKINMMIINVNIKITEINNVHNETASLKKIKEMASLNDQKTMHEMLADAFNRTENLQKNLHKYFDEIKIEQEKETALKESIKILKSNIAPIKFTLNEIKKTLQKEYEKNEDKLYDEIMFDDEYDEYYDNDFLVI